MKKRSLVFILLIFLTLQSAIFFHVHAFKTELGDRGTGVKEVQQYLFNLGYDVSVDGIYGNQTKIIVKDFQYNNGLKVDGVVGDNTFKLLKEVCKNINYTVKKGDTLSTIAVNYNVSIADIKRINNLKSDLITINQELIIPKTGIGGGDDNKLYSTIYHVIERGDSLYTISKRYGVDIQTIKLANKLTTDLIIIGQTIVIPYNKANNNEPFKLTKGALIWPVLGRISSGYGYRIHPIRKTRHFHGGIDIAIPLGTKIYAAAGGRIVQSGYYNGFGKTIIIDHGNNIRTLYAHNSRLLVRTGAKVTVGQVIALSGSTGTSTGPHLDFRIYNNEKTVNPLNFLP
ncbi:MAG: LysM peptidoglycan-binding domain-containing protein [Firmicutes bacterium]|nr:LysM peptidoglycan-binding domain-containing protein [Bacillota bacterium]